MTYGGNKGAEAFNNIKKLMSVLHIKKQLSIPSGKAQEEREFVGNSMWSVQDAEEELRLRSS